MRRQHHVAVGLAYLTAGMVAILLVMMAVTANSTSEVKRGNELAACRSQVRTTIDTAMGDVLAAKSRLDLLTSEGFEASIHRDDAALQAVVDRGPAARAQVDDAVDVLSEATARYRVAVRESVEDPAGFLARCRHQNQ